jgi:uncharacterized protein YecE (DUF72 family)
VTFYRLPLASTFDRWYRETPPGFAFSVKGSRFITHVKRLREPEEPLERFFGGALRLGEKLSVVLWQFPPGFGFDAERLHRFLELLRKYPARNTLEFRNESWMREEVRSACVAGGASLCLADWPGFLDDLPPTSDFVYLRRHGEGGNHAACYSRAAQKRDAKRVREYLDGGRDVFVYFNNDVRGYAPANACVLMEEISASARSRGRIGNAAGGRRPPA